MQQIHDRCEMSKGEYWHVIYVKENWLDGFGGRSVLQLAFCHP